MQPATYSFLDVVAAITGPGGAFPLGSGSGAAEEGITVEYTEDKNTMTVGADGSVMHGLNAGNSGTITFRYLKTSPVNGLLSAMYAFQRSSSALWGQNVLTIANPQTGDVVTGRQAAFKKNTGLTYAKNAGMNEWAFDVGQLDELLGIGSPAAA